MNTQFARRTVALIGIAAASYGFTGSAQAKGTAFYTTLNLGLTHAPDVKDSLNVTTKLNNGMGVSAALGYRYGENMRAEAEVLYGKNSVDTLTDTAVNGGNSENAGGRVSTLALMANGYYDFKTNTAIVPYVGAGIGVAKISVNDVSAPGFTVTNDSDNVLAWQFKAGVSYPVSKRTDVTFGYRFFDTRRLSLVSDDGTRFTSDGARIHSLEIGLRYGF